MQKKFNKKCVDLYSTLEKRFLEAPPQVFLKFLDEGDIYIRNYYAGYNNCSSRLKTKNISDLVQNPLLILNNHWWALQYSQEEKCRKKINETFAELYSKLEKRFQKSPCNVSKFQDQGVTGHISDLVKNPLLILNNHSWALQYSQEVILNSSVERK